MKFQFFILYSFDQSDIFLPEVLGRVQSWIPSRAYVSCQQKKLYCRTLVLQIHFQWQFSWEKWMFLFEKGSWEFKTWPWKVQAGLFKSKSCDSYLIYFTLKSPEGLIFERLRMKTFLMFIVAVYAQIWNKKWVLRYNFIFCVIKFIDIVEHVISFLAEHIFNCVFHLYQEHRAQWGLSPCTLSDQTIF